MPLVYSGYVVQVLYNHHVFTQVLFTDDDDYDDDDDGDGDNTLCSCVIHFPLKHLM